MLFLSQIMPHEYYICVLDFEATCWPEERNDQIREIIEFPSILYKVDYKNKIHYISEFAEYVRPVINPNLSKYCTELTGIEQHQVDGARVLKDVYKDHCKWLVENVPIGSKFTFVTVGKWDLDIMLPIEAHRYGIKLNNYYRKWIDLKDEFRHFYGRTAGGMMNMLSKLNIKHKGRHHSGISDCRNTAEIVLRMISDGHIFL
jgi:inhibitor of KinA sporulation pathway (predicted exonuclease)